MKLREADVDREIAKKALAEAAAPIYFTDSADYIRGLWSVVNTLAPALGYEVPDSEQGMLAILKDIEPDVYAVDD